MHAIAHVNWKTSKTKNTKTMHTHTHSHTTCKQWSQNKVTQIRTYNIPSSDVIKESVDFFDATWQHFNLLNKHRKRWMTHNDSKVLQVWPVLMKTSLILKSLWLHLRHWYSKKAHKMQLILIFESSLLLKARHGSAKNILLFQSFFFLFFFVLISKLTA